MCKIIPFIDFGNFIQCFAIKDKLLIEIRVYQVIKLNYRYNVERLCNSLNLVSRLMEWDQPIQEAYYPMISTDVSGKAWPARPPNMRLSDINRPDQQLSFDIEDLRRWKERIFEAIHKKKIIHSNGTEIDINNDSGINVLGNIIESSVLSPNADYYGSLHNFGHSALAFIHDPEYKYMVGVDIFNSRIRTNVDIFI